jgi:hypothetical protein
MRLLLKTLLLGPMLLLISCGKFNWDPRPYVGDSASQSLVNGQGETISCNEPMFDQMTCFDPMNIAELKTAIDSIKNDKRRIEAQSTFKRYYNK